MKFFRYATVVLVSSAAVFAIGWAARASYQAPGADAALLRLSWRLRGEREETCRPRTQEELAALPVHMRTPEVCEGKLVAYRLIVQVDDESPDTSRILPAGAKGDRPVYVLEEKRLSPGSHRVRIGFDREDVADRDADQDADEDEEHTDNDDFPAFAMDTVLEMSAGVIELITMAPTGRRLEHRTAGPGSRIQQRRD